MKKLLFSTGCFCLAAHILLMAPACKKDNPSPNDKPAFCDTISVTTYTNGVKSIIDNSCAYAGCHDGAGGIGPGNFNNYNGLKPFLSNGAMFERVINRKDDPAVGMPPNKSVYPQSQKDDLTEAELRIMRCWLLSEFPE